MPRSDATPGAGGGAGRTALLIIDMQNAFFEDEDEALSWPREGLVAACNGLVRAARRGEAPVLMARTEHLPDGSTWTRSMLDDGQGIIFRGSRQADAVDGFDVEGLQAVTKVRDSAFFGNPA